MFYQETGQQPVSMVGRCIIIAMHAYIHRCRYLLLTCIYIDVIASM